MCMGASDQDFSDVCDFVNGGRQTALPPGAGPFITDWKNFLFKIREKLAHPYTFQKELDIHEMLREWRDFSKELIEVVGEAHEEVETCLKNVSYQREQTLAVSGRLLWGTLTLFVPPPVGVVLGALVYAATEDNLRGGLQRFVEWGMQAPEPYGGPNNRVAPRARPNTNPRSGNSGGHEKIRDLKDIGQMIKSVEKIFGGERGKWLKELNEVSLRKLVHVPDLQRGMADALQSLVTSVCEQGQEFLKQALVQEMITLVNDDAKLRRITETVQMLQLGYLMQPNRPQGDASPKAVIREGVTIFLNRLAHEQVESVKNARSAERAPLLSQNLSMRNDLKRRFQLLLFAQYFNANRENYQPPLPSARTPATWNLPGRGVVPGAAAQPDHFAIMYGVVPNAFFSSSYAGTFLNSLLVSPLEEKLTKLKVIRKVANPADIATWSLPRDLAQPVPYTTVDRAFRGRLRAWADFYCGDRVSLAARSDEIARVFFTTHAPKLLRVS
ncbi:MAG: hypothetical protein ABW321_24590 [Polyangiales bacterium]